MEFIDTITVFNKVDQSYKKYVLDGVYWYGSKGLVISGNGVVHSDEINIFIPKEKMKDYTESYQDKHYTLRKGDHIVKGIAEDIQSVNELSKYKDVITITKVSVHQVNSDLDNILVTGK